MIIFEINAVPYGSTGRIMFQIADAVKAAGGCSIYICVFYKIERRTFPGYLLQNRWRIWKNRAYHFGKADWSTWLLFAFCNI